MTMHLVLKSVCSMLIEYELIVSVCKSAVSDCGSGCFRMSKMSFCLKRIQHLDDMLASGKTPRAAKHTKVFALKLEYGAILFQLMQNS